MARTWVQIVLGQLVSLDLAIINFTLSFITNQGVDAPLSVSFFSYMALALVYATIMLYRRQKLQVSWYWYVALGFVDVQGNYLVVKAYEYTSITSVTLLDCCSIAWTIVLTWLFLRTRYTSLQFLGVAVSLIGLALLLLSDYDPTAQDGPKPLLGDILVIAGTVFLSMSNVGLEFCVKKKDRVEAMAMIGLFGMLVTAFVIIRIFIYNQQVKWLYYPAYALVVVGIVVYLRTGKDVVDEELYYCAIEKENGHQSCENPNSSLLVEEAKEG